jgi:hypothetical protein
MTASRTRPLEGAIRLASAVALTAEALKRWRWLTLKLVGHREAFPGINRGAEPPAVFSGRGPAPHIKGRNDTRTRISKAAVWCCVSLTRRIR